MIGFQTGILAGVLGVTALIVDGNHQLHSIAHTGLVVISAKAGGGVNAAGTGVHGNVFCVD